MKAIQVKKNVKIENNTKPTVPLQNNRFQRVSTCPLLLGTLALFFLQAPAQAAAPERSSAQGGRSG